jgi:RNA polymerase sigma factor (sigma-70 family)
MMSNDMELVREYAASQSERAFETLVSRHVNLVYSAVLRQVRDPHLAEEISQAVFVILARKADSLGSKTILSGWLYRTARFAAADALKTRRRRERREQEACMQSTFDDHPMDAAWQELSPLLDEAMAQLRDKDRDALVLRYFENKSLREVGDALGLQERAAQKRVARGLEKLHAFFARRGIASTTAIIAGAVSANSIQAAPVALAKSISAVAVTKGVAVSGSTLTLIKGALKLMAWTKAKTAIVVGVGVLLTASVTPHVWYYHLGPNSWRHRFEAAYQLKPGQIVKHITPVQYIPERAEYYHREETFRSQSESVKTPPDAFCFEQDEQGQLHYHTAVFGPGTTDLKYALLMIFKFHAYEFEGSASLLDLDVSGDWTIREGTSRESLLAALEPILRKASGHNIRFEKRTVEREVIVVHGLPNVSPENHTIQIYSEDATGSFMGNGSGNIQEFLKSVEDILYIPLIDETQKDAQSPASLFTWEGHIDGSFNPYRRPKEQQAKVREKVLNNLAAQTGLSFTNEQRPVEVWFIAERP